MKSPPIFICAFLAAICVSAKEPLFRLPEGESPNHLSPPSINGDLDYEILLNDKLLSRWGRGHHGTMLAMPAFTGEYCVSIYEEDTKDLSGGSKSDEPKTFTATTARASRNLFGWLQEKKRDDRVSDVEITHHSRAVSRDLAVAFQRVWARAILQTRYPSAVPPAISDGISYRFSVVLDIGEISGEARNPEGTLAVEMANIGFALYELVTGSNAATKGTEEDLIKRLQSLEKRLQ
jgi:hypothetical protein